MSFDIKTYKYLKIIHYFKKINFFFFFHGTSLSKINWTKIEQLLNKEELKCSQVLNSLMIKIIKNSIFKNISVLIHGLILLLHTNNTKLSLQQLDNISVLINLLCLKLNNKVYSKRQVKNLKQLSYIENIYLFYSSMQVIIKMPYYQFKNKKAIWVSK